MKKKIDSKNFPGLFFPYKTEKEKNTQKKKGARVCYKLANICAGKTFVLCWQDSQQVLKTHSYNIKVKFQPLNTNTETLKNNYQGFFFLSSGMVLHHTQQKKMSIEQKLALRRFTKREHKTRPCSITKRKKFDALRLTKRSTNWSEYPQYHSIVR